MIFIFTACIAGFHQDAMFVPITVKRYCSSLCSFVIIIESIGLYFTIKDKFWNPFGTQNDDNVGDGFVISKYTQISIKSAGLSSAFTLAIFMLKPFIRDFLKFIRTYGCCYCWCVLGKKLRYKLQSTRNLISDDKNMPQIHGVNTVMSNESVSLDVTIAKLENLTSWQKVKSSAKEMNTKHERCTFISKRPYLEWQNVKQEETNDKHDNRPQDDNCNNNDNERTKCVPCAV